MAKAKVKYVDGFVFTVKKTKLAEYKKMAAIGKKVWMKHGALGYKECVINDRSPKWITLTFPKLTKAKPSEIVCFSYIEYKSKKHRDQVNAKVMKDEEMQPPKDHKESDMPFDMKKMAYGGFEVVVGD